MDQGILLYDRDSDSYGSFFKVGRLLFQCKTEYQEIMVFDTPDMGRVLMLDGIFNAGPVMEAFYHEPMAHIPMAMTAGEKNVLIIGGGDFGVAMHLLKHKSVQNLTLCELDPEVLKVCRKFFPEWAKAENDPRMRVHVGDGFDFLRDSEPERFDAIIIDSTDPFMGESVLISEEFYRLAQKALKSGGVIMQIIADYIFYKSVWLKVMPRVKKFFSCLNPVFLPIPFYSTGSWGLIIAGKNKKYLDPEKVSAQYLDNIEGIKTMTSELVKGWFSLPPMLQEEFGPYVQKIPAKNY